MYFMDILRLKKDKDLIVFCFRVSEDKVEEHKIPIDKVRGVVDVVLGEEWFGSSVFKVKKKGGGVWLKINTNVYRADIYRLSNAEFQVLKVKLGIYLTEG